MLDRVRGLFRRKTYQMPSSNGGWFPIIREAKTGYWQRNIEVNATTAASYYANFACVTLIARDIAKLSVRLIQKTPDEIWIETVNPAFSPVLRKPNHYQTRNQFWESWFLSKLGKGNTYALKDRDNRGVVVGLYVLDPTRVQPLIAQDGSVFYQLSTDELNGLPEQVTVPATEIIHDRFNCLGHPLVGVAPIHAAALAATQGINIQQQSVRLFRNNANPSGILTAPGNISDEDVERLKTEWEKKFSGENYGRVAVLGSALKFEAMSVTARDSQLVEQLKWSSEQVAAVYHVPAFMIGAGAEPNTGNAQERTLRYYTQALQSLIEEAESCLDDGLGLGDKPDLGVEFDTDNLLRMDTAMLMDVLEKGRNYLKPNEGRRRLGLPKVAGGDAVYRQQQDFSLEALAKRDAQEDPFATEKPQPERDPPPDVDPPEDPELDDDDAKSLAAWRLEKAVGALMEAGR
ncbi:MAG: phage portal protein [Rhodospirillales bacterium 24-66-33]|nr:MAG: phage portal protein [Rhodospirillales bacterium 35-66-84]OYZ91540.1 MAG: phage portal protein [Rhodospirillales bacterium 24-66-33]OZB26299.1 MAG: phage portal protein [Rhodospirillales bacterium 39-66-50]